MNPHFSTIEDGKKKIAEYWDMYPILPDIDKIKTYMIENVDTITPELLSIAAMKLSVYLCNLGGLVAQITAEANESYMFRKFAYMWEYTALKSDIKGKVRENMALDKSFGYHKQELINRFVADFMKEYKEDLERVVMAMQSRLRTLQGERISEMFDAKQEKREH